MHVTKLMPRHASPALNRILLKVVGTSVGTESSISFSFPLLPISFYSLSSISTYPSRPLNIVGRVLAASRFSPTHYLVCQLHFLPHDTLASSSSFQVGCLTRRDLDPNIQVCPSNPSNVGGWWSVPNTIGTGNSSPNTLVLLHCYAGSAKHFVLLPPSFSTTISPSILFTRLPLTR